MYGQILVSLLRQLSLFSVETFAFVAPMQWDTADAEIQDLSVVNPELKGLPLKLGADPYIARHAKPAARDFFLADFYPPGPFTCIFLKPLWNFSCADCG